MANAIFTVMGGLGLLIVGYVLGRSDERKSAHGIAPQAKPADDTLRLDAIAQNCWDLRCFSHSDGEDYGWRVIEHHMAKPNERIVVELYSSDPRKAIDAAIAAPQGDDK